MKKENDPSEDKGIELDEDYIIDDVIDFLEETGLGKWWNEIPVAIEELHQ